MPTDPRDCANYELNLRMCPCTKESCGNRGICCECLAAHVAAGSASACMRGAQRDAATLGLLALAASTCATNHERNRAWCPCTWEPCERKGICCNCVRNHFTADGSGRVACIKSS